METIKNIVTTIWNAISNTISTILTNIKNTVSNIWNGIKTTIVNIVNSIKSAASNTFNSMHSAIKSIVGNIASSIKNGFQSAINYITSLPAMAIGWGRDMIMGIVNGIRGAIGHVKDAVKDVADSIKSYLHFSVPDEGPLTDYEEWMPDFMKGLAKGINENKGIIKRAISGVASDMVISPSVSSQSELINYGAKADNQSGIISAIQSAFNNLNLSSGDTVIPVYIGNTLIDELIIDSKKRLSIRSGGMSDV